MKAIYFTATSLDGYIADPDHSLAWLFQFEDGDGGSGGQNGAEADGGSFAEFFENVGAIAMGSGTYEWLLRNHVYADPGPPKPWPHEQPTWVFTSRTLETVPGADVRFARGDVVPVSEAMREAAAGKDLWIAGGGDLAAQFHAAGLLDELVVTIAPVFLTAGSPLFTRPIVTPPLEVVGVKAHPNGLTDLRLRVQKAP